MRICFDLDGVISELKQGDQSYADLKPIDGAIEKIQALKDDGHYIIIHTARRMRTHKGNLPGVIADIGKITLDWLAKYEIPYDEILFGKPWAHVYIDDNGFRFENWDQISDDAKSLPNWNELSKL